MFQLRSHGSIKDEIIDIDKYISRGYRPETIKAVLGHMLVESVLIDFCEWRVKILSSAENGTANKCLSDEYDNLLYMEIRKAAMFWLSYRGNDKEAYTFRDMLEEYFNIINWDEKKLRRSISRARGGRKRIEAFINSVQNPFNELLDEADALWEKMIHNC